MKLNAILIVCVLCAIVVELVFAVTAFQQDFPIFNASGTNQTTNFVDVNGNVGAEDSRFMWNNTGLALIAQAFVLFAAAAATLGLLRNGEEKHA
jgi:hypothetical protein